MSENDVQIIRGAGARIEFDTQDWTTSYTSAVINAGEPVMRDEAASNFVVIIANNAPEISSDMFVGVAAEVSSETNTVDGKCLVDLAIPGLTVMRGNATTSTNA
ncbi:unnamed protein product, partial [marine sediment metagenome]